jgi:hypothetical protein
MIRKPTTQEVALLDVLIKKSSVPISKNWKKDLLVRPMDDGGMGSLQLFPNKKNRNRVFGSQVSEHQFIDLDGVEVIVSLNVDIEGDLMELDIWKTDFSKLIQIPSVQISS